jgi:hypothetical protein
MLQHVFGCYRNATGMQKDVCPKVTLVTEGYMIGKKWNLTLGDSHFFYIPQGGPLRSCGSAQKKGKNVLVRM